MRWWWWRGRWRWFVNADPYADPPINAYYHANSSRHLHHRGDGYAGDCHCTRHTGHGDREGVFLIVFMVCGPPKEMKNGFCPATAVLGGVALSFVIPTEAKRSGGICSSADLSWKCFSTEAYPDFLRRGTRNNYVCGFP
jgi:hypothetical protein